MCSTPDLFGCGNGLGGLGGLAGFVQADGTPLKAKPAAAAAEPRRKCLRVKPAEKGDAPFRIKWFPVELDLFAVEFVNAIRLVCGALILTFIFAVCNPGANSPLRSAPMICSELSRARGDFEYGFSLPELDSGSASRPGSSQVQKSACTMGFGN
jgi:hypothetical protein